MRANYTNPSGGLDQSAKSYRPDIDGLRAIAILSVVLCHANVPGITGGFTGVDIFFVISGYLIGGHIYSEVCAGNFSYLRFYQRRAKRILPAFFAVMVFTLLAALVLLSPLEASKCARAAFAATLSVSNLLFWHSANYFQTKSDLIPLLMTWSLGVEEQFYAVIPVLLVLLARIRRNWTLPAILAGCTLSFLLAQYQLDGHSQRAFQAAFYLLPARAWELGVGGALAVGQLRAKRRPMAAWIAPAISLTGVILTVAPLFLLDAHSLFPGATALPSVLGTAMLIAVPASWVNRRLLSMPTLVFIGRVSYSWYLWHWPLLAYLNILFGGKLPRTAPIAAVAVAFVAAVLSYFFIEQPFRRSPRAPRPLLLRYAAVTAGLLAVCAAIWLSHGLPQRYPQLARMEAANPSLSSDPCLIDNDDDQPNLSARCFDQADTRPSVALWGDSHAAALAPGVRSAAAEQGYGLIQMNKAACLPLTGALRYIPLIPAQASRCLSFNRRVLSLLQSDHSIRIVILAGDWAGCLDRTWERGWLTADTSHASAIPSLDAVQTLFAESLRAQIETLRAAQKVVLVLEDIPNFDFDPLERVRRARIPARQILSRWLGAESAGDSGFAPNGVVSADALADATLRQAVPRDDGVELIDLKPAFCAAPGRCAYRDGDRLLYADSGHLTIYGAQYAARSLRLPAVTSNPQPWR
jgi:peptidoglycan/LPS O-acetylase OafA/YrhL